MHRLTLLLFASCLLCASSAAAQPVVTVVSPTPQTIQADYNTDITVEFDGKLDPGSVNAGTIRVFGRWSGPMPGTITVEGINTRLRFDPAQQFFAGEWVTVAVEKSLKSQNGTPMTFSYTWNFWIRTNTGTMDMTLLGTVPIREPGEDWIQSYGSYAGDLNNDGFSDMSIPSEQSADIRVFMNDGAGNYGPFATTQVPGGDRPSTNEGADFDHDGEIDIVVGNATGTTVGVLLGDGAGGWKSNASYTVGDGVRGVGVLDLNGDGYDDIVTSNRFDNNVSLLLNNGDGTFGGLRTMEGGGSSEFSLAVADANNDGLMDVFIGAYTSQEIILLLGDGVDSLIFSDKVSVAGRPWMLAVGDIDNDGNVDVASANSLGDVATIVFGDGAGNLSTPVSYSTGRFPLAIDLGDIDGDGDLDLVTSNYSGNNWTLYENLGGGIFGNVRTLAASSSGSCAILHDRDNDLDLDISAIDELDDLIFIFDNQPSPTAATDAPTRGVVLLQNHPNPFNPSTTISFSLERAMRVALAIYDVRGREVATLVDRRFTPGLHRVSWDGIDAGGAPVGSGIYFYRLSSGGKTLGRKMMLLK